MNKKIVTIIGILVVLILAVLFLRDKIFKISVEYTISQVNNYNYFLYHKDDKSGVIDRNGKVIIEANYDNIEIPNPEKDVFICYDEEKSIALNSSNKKIFDEYEEVEAIKIKNVVSVLHFEKSVLKYKKDGKYGLIDFDGKEITKNIYNLIENLQGTEGKFLVGKDGNLGVVNLNGTQIIEPKYNSVKTDGYYSEKTGYINSGFITSIKTEEGYRYGYINHDGTKVLNEEYTEVTRVPNKDEVYLITSKNGKYGLYKNSKKLLDNSYQSISYTDNGVLIIQKNKNYGISNLDGKIIVDTNYSKIEEKGIFLYAQNSNESVVFNINGEKQDINFNKVIYETENDKYRIVTLLNNNIMYYGIENNEGNALVSPSYSYIEYAYNEYFIAKNDSGNLGIINSKGDVLVDFKYDTLQKIKGKSILQAIVPKTKKMEIYSSKLEKVFEVENAILTNENGYISIIKDKDIHYFDENGNALKEGSNVLESIKLKNFPETIGAYKKVQTSIENIYYE